MNSNSAIKISNLFVSYNDIPKNLQVISDFNLDVRKGEFISIIGPSGCGKTTLLYTIAGLIGQQRGKIIMNNKTQSSSMSIAIAFQDSLLFPWRNVLENISYGAEMVGLAKEETAKKCEELLKLMHLERFRSYYPHQLSGGMKQRVNIARALCINPQALLLDEPFSNLDSQIREIMQEELLNVFAKTNKTFILVTHNIEEAIFLSDRIVVLSKRPSRIKKIIKIDLRRPRDKKIKDSKSFIAIRREVARVIKDEIQV